MEVFFSSCDITASLSSSVRISSSQPVQLSQWGGGMVFIIVGVMEYEVARILACLMPIISMSMLLFARKDLIVEMAARRSEGSPFAHC